MDDFIYGDSLNGESPLPAFGEHKSIGDFGLWAEAVHETGFMDGVAREATTFARAPHQIHADEDGDLSSDGTDNGERDETRVVLNKKRTARAIVANMKPSYYTVRQEAYKLFDQGRNRRDNTTSCKQALRETPAAFACKGITFMKHQLSEAGRQRVIIVGPADKDDKDSNTASLAQLPGSILAFEMGLGKTFPAIDVANHYCRVDTPKFLSPNTGRKKPIAIIVPPQLLSTWVEQMDKFLSVKYLVYRPKMPVAPDDLIKHQVILTTYENVRQEHQAYCHLANVRDERRDGHTDQPLPLRGSYPLMVVEFGVLIADEISKASRQSSQTSKAMCTLKAVKRLGLTGTPLENDYDELQTLTRWLQVSPWGNIATFNEYFVQKESKESKAKTLEGMRNAIFATMMRAFVFPLRIDDTFDGKKMVDFARAKRVTIRHDLDADEWAHQEKMAFLWGGSSIEPPPRGTWLKEILMARMKCVHPLCGGRVTYGDRGDHDTMLDIDGDDDGESALDSIMQNSLVQEPVITEENTFDRISLKEEVREGKWRSSRIKMLIEKVQEQLHKDSEGKILIFDEFLQSLDIVSVALTENKILYEEFNGHMSLEDRDQAKGRFMDPRDKARIMLITIQCGGIGLNLMEANKVFILTPRWNPQLDQQAIARANRNGQLREVTVWDFYCDDSMERHVKKRRHTKMIKEFLVLNPDGVPSKTIEEMATWDEETFNLNMKSLREESKAKRLAAKKALKEVQKAKSGKAPT